jgi:hypothetical protein
MATETLATISAALSQLFAPDIARQWNRMAVTAALLEARKGRGKNVAWDTEFSGTSAQSVAEGSDVAESEFVTDINVPAVLSWGTYRASFKVSELEIDAAVSSQGSADALLDIFGERVLNAGAKLASVINQDLITGTGTDGNGNPNIIGLLGGSTDATGTYAGLNRATYSEWAGNVLGNGGIARPLTQDLLYQLEQNIFTACGEPPNLIITSAGVFRKYAGLFEAVRRIMTDGRGPTEYDTATSDLFWKGIPVIRDRNFSAGRLVMVNTNYLYAHYLPRFQPGDAVMQKMEMLEGSSGQKVKNVTGIPARIAILAKTGDAVKCSVKTALQMVMARPNSTGQLNDLLET